MDFEDYALAGLGTAGGLALGGKVVGQHLGNKWGEQGYYRSKASSLGTQSDADIEYQQAAQQIANSDLPPKIKQRELQKLQLQRQKVVGKSLQNMETNAENSRGWNRGKGLVAGTLGTAAVGGALGLGYGISNDFKRDDRKILSNFSMQEEDEQPQPPKKRNIRKAATIAVGTGLSAGIGMDAASRYKDYLENTPQGYHDLKGFRDTVSNGLGNASKRLGGLADDFAQTKKPWGVLDSNEQDGERFKYFLNQLREAHQNHVPSQFSKFTRKYNSTYVQFKKAYNQAVANFIDPSAIASEGIGDYLGLGLGSLAGAEIGRAGSAQIKAKALRRSADPNERHNQMLAAQLEAAQQIQDPVQRAKAIAKAQSQADYESAKLQRWAGLKGGLLQAGYTGLGATTGLVGNTIAHHWNN